MPKLSGPQVTSTTHVRRTQATERIECCAVVVHSPLPGFQYLELAIVQQLNQAVPLIVRRLGDERYGRSRLPAWSVCFHLVPQASVAEVRSTSHCRTALAIESEGVGRMAHQTGSVKLRNHAGDRRRDPVSTLP